MSKAIRPLQGCEYDKRYEVNAYFICDLDDLYLLFKVIYKNSIRNRVLLKESGCTAPSFMGVSEIVERGKRAKPSGLCRKENSINNSPESYYPFEERRHARPYGPFPTLGQ